MKRRIIITVFASVISCLGAMAQVPMKTSPVGGKTLQIHQMAHKQQLANAKMRMDKSVLKDFVKNDVDRREAEAIGIKTLSAESAEMIGDLLKEARKHMGKRYRSGAKGPSAFDCSGFSSYVYRQFGYELSSSSRDQFQEGEKVELRELREGDLVFFTGRNRKGGVGHVGIVVSADNEKGTFKFIHASTTGGIKIDGSDGYYAPRYLGARRVITE